MRCWGLVAVGAAAVLLIALATAMARGPALAGMGALAARRVELGAALVLVYGLGLALGRVVWGRRG